MKTRLACGAAAVLAATRRAACAVACVALAGCSTLLPQTAALDAAPPEHLPERAALDHVAFVPQDENLCGPAALKMSLSGAGIEAPLDELKRQVFLPGVKGSLQAEMLAAPRRHGLVGYRLAPRLEDLLREVAAGTPVIVLHDYGVWPVHAWHYAVVVGYDYPRREVMLHSGLKARARMPIGIFELLWKPSDYWAMVVSPPQKIPVTARESSYVEAVAAVEQAGDLRAARAAYDAALQRWPGNLPAAVGLANTHYALGDLKQAETTLRRAVERNADSPVLLNNLAQTLSELGRNAEALAVIDRAAALGGPFAATVQATRRDIVQRMPAAR